MKGKADITATLVRTTGLAIDLSAKEGANLPVRMKVLNWGENPNARGKRVFVGPKFVQALKAPTYPFRKIPLDFEHNTLEGTPAYAETREPRAVAGFSALEVAEGDGVYITMLSWTPDGLKTAANFADLSAACVTDKDGNVLMIPSVALCRTGAVEGMDFVQVTLSVDASALSGSDAPNNPEVKKVDWKQMLCESLGLDPATATDAEIKAALTSALKKTPDSTCLNAAIKEALQPIADQVLALNAAGAQFQAELAKRDKQQALDQARSEGRVVALSASVLEKMTLEEVREHVRGVPVTVPLSARTPAHVQDDAAGCGPTDAQREIALNCGADPEKVFGKK